MTDATWPNPKYEPHYTSAMSRNWQDVFRAVLLFHSGGEWTQAKRDEWKRITGTHEATNKVLCDHIRMIFALYNIEEQER